MDSKEFGLVFTRQLIGMEDLHYGYWDETIPAVSVLHLNQAQQRYTEQLIDTLEQHGSQDMPILGAGCGTEYGGTGHLNRRNQKR